MVICLEGGTHLHMAKLVPLPLTVSSFSKIRLTRVVLEKGLLNMLFHKVSLCSFVHV